MADQGQVGVLARSKATRLLMVSQIFCSAIACGRDFAVIFVLFSTGVAEGINAFVTHLVSELLRHDLSNIRKVF